VVPRIFVAGLVIVVVVPVATLVEAAAPVAAAQAVPARNGKVSAQAPPDDPVKIQVSTFELALQGAITHAGQELAEWTQERTPNLQLMPAADPQVHGAPLGNGVHDLVFHVETAEIIGVELFDQAVRLLPMGTAMGPGRLTSAGMVTTDPVSTTGPVADAALALDHRGPDQAYSDFLHDALIDAMLDSSESLKLKDDQSLTVFLTPIDAAVTNPFYRNRSRTLILTVSGRDLAQFHAGKITREQAKTGIVERHF
jgi:hypothetical protein